MRATPRAAAERLARFEAVAADTNLTRDWYRFVTSNGTDSCRTLRDAFAPQSLAAVGPAARGLGL